MLDTALVVLTILFALNMGTGNFATSFAAAHGVGLVTTVRARILFIIFVFIGAILVGGRVTATLSNDIIPPELLSLDILVIVMFSCTVSMVIANLLKVSQATSYVTIGSLLGVGLFYKQVYLKSFAYLVPLWILFPVLGYFATYTIGKLIYPPRASNFWLYENLVNHRGRLKAFVLISSCYNAFSVGANNVANAVGPLAGAGIVPTLTGLMLIAPVFGAGSFLFASNLKTTSEEIVPIGIFTATIICLVCGTIIIIASLLGVPQSFVMIKMACVMAVSGLKEGHRETFDNPVIRKIILTWIITPAIAVTISYLLVTIRAAFTH